MTAEIAIMNRGAIALAADSAVTIRSYDGTKIYNTVSKLFRLSKHMPVGIMLFGKADILGLPWETIIKEYRKFLVAQKFDTLEEYAKNFLGFVENNDLFFPEDRQIEYISAAAEYWLAAILHDIKDEVKNYLKCNSDAPNPVIQKIAAKIISKRHDEAKELDSLNSFPSERVKAIRNKNKNLIKKKIVSIFEKLPCYKKDKEKLIDIVLSVLCKDYFPPECSGIVIAGFGERDLFPRTVAFAIEAVIDGILKYKVISKSNIGNKSSSTIQPFAQGDMVATFVEGVDPNLKLANSKYVTELFSKIPDVIIDAIKNIDDKEKNDLKENVKKAGETLLTEYFSKLKEVQEEHFINNLIRTVGTLPKNELAEMAESLVNLTAFKLKVTMKDETVGGPIDVAIISKGDGFVWIKRKNYFDISQNLHYSRLHY